MPTDTGLEEIALENLQASKARLHELPPNYAAIPCIKRFMLNHLNGHQNLENAATACYNSLRAMAAPFTDNKGE